MNKTDMPIEQKRKIVIGVSGASGSVYAKMLFDSLQTAKLKEQYETIGVVFSTNAKEIWEYELGDSSYSEIPFLVYQKNDFNAPFASGSSVYDTMIICPCSMGVIGRINAGISDDLMTRAADVILKERRKLILVPRETPFSSVHIKNMLELSQHGTIICPAIPSFYSKPNTIDELVRTVTDRVLHHAGFELNSYRWGA